MKMNVKVEFPTPTPAQMEAYLKEAGWTQTGVRTNNDGLEEAHYWKYTEDIYGAVVAMIESYSDYDYTIIVTLDMLSDIEERPRLDILKDILSVSDYDLAVAPIFDRNLPEIQALEARMAEIAQCEVRPTKYIGYYVSENGIVFSLRGGKRGGPKAVVEPKILAQTVSVTAKGLRLLRVGLHIDPNKSAKCVFVGRLIAEAFIPNPEELPCAKFVDKDSTNISLSNIYWGVVGSPRTKN